MRGAREPCEALELRMERSVWVWLYLCVWSSNYGGICPLDYPFALQSEENNALPTLSRSETPIQNGSEHGCHGGKLQAKSGSECRW